MSSHEKPREAWAITGSGHYLKECLDLVQQRPDVDLFLSKAAAEVLPMYDFDLKSIRQQITCFR
ncbi:MAG: flavoprotein, partial [Candidatus Thiodiazotropha sp. (ex Codakia orbicularis)]|nr:flavoprotein [Candidatus Thiodiazotropha sp. (ex Codakia orbicularis)]